MAFERSWPAVAPRLFLSDGSQYGLIQLNDTSGFKVKATVVLQSSSQSPLLLEVKRVLSTTQLIVGRIGKSINDKSDIRAFTLLDGAFIYAEEQEKVKVPEDDRGEAVYEQEPTVAIRNVLVDQQGDFYDESNPLPISTVNTGGGLVPPNFDEVQIIRDSDGDASSYRFLLASALQGTINVTYDANKSSVKYKKA